MSLGISKLYRFLGQTGLLRLYESIFRTNTVVEVVLPKKLTPDQVEEFKRALDHKLKCPGNEPLLLPEGTMLIRVDGPQQGENHGKART